MNFYAKFFVDEKNGDMLNGGAARLQSAPTIVMRDINNQR